MAAGEAMVARMVHMVHIGGLEAAWGQAMALWVRMVATVQQLIMLFMRVMVRMAAPVGRMVVVGAVVCFMVD